MAKRKLTIWEKQLRKNVAAYQLRVDAIFAKYTEELVHVAAAIPGYDPNKLFKFADYPMTKARVDDLLGQMSSDLSTTIANGVDSAWTLADAKNDDMVYRALGGMLDKLPPDKYEHYFRRHDEALHAYKDRRVAGMNLSDRVWKYTGQFQREIEMGVGLGIRDGVDAATMTKNVKQYLQYPDKLFRRVRNEFGQLVLSKAAKAFHPGAGVYRSSFKNARRLTATETNIAYRTSDFTRWNDLDFVVGIKVQKSHTNPGPPDMCDQLAGNYPKDFKFVGWHPLCRCFATSILKTPDELVRDVNDGVNRPSVNAVRELPDNMTAYVHDNAGRIARTKNLPYFLRDNGHRAEDGSFVFKEFGKGLSTKPAKPAIPSGLEVAAQRHANRTSEQIRAIKDAWSERRLTNLWVKQNRDDMKDLINSKYLPADAKAKIRIMMVLNNRQTARDIQEAIDVLRTAELRHITRKLDDAEVERIKKAWAESRARLAQARAAQAAANESITDIFAEFTKAVTIGDDAIIKKPAASPKAADVKGLLDNIKKMVGTEVRPQNNHPARSLLNIISSYSSDYAAAFTTRRYWADNDLDVICAIPKRLLELTKIKPKELAKIPAEYRSEFATLLKTLTTAEFPKYGYIGYQSEIDHAYNIFALSKSAMAREIGYDKISSKMPVQFFEEFTKHSGFRMADTMPKKEFYDTMPFFVPVKFSAKNEAYHRPGTNIVTWGVKNDDFQRRMKKSAAYRETLQYHEFGHARDYCRKRATGAEWRDDKIWDDILSKYKAKYAPDITTWRDAYITEVNKYGGFTAIPGNEEEMIGKWTDTLQAFDPEHKEIFYRHPSGYYAGKPGNQKAEIIAHASEIFWHGNPQFKNIDPELWQDLYDAVKFMTYGTK